MPHSSPVPPLATAGLFDRLTRHDALFSGWLRVFRNGGGPGGDRVTLHDFATRLDGELARLSHDLGLGCYRPGPLRRLTIPKRDGGGRPLAIPCVRDRVVHATLHELLLPLLEAEFEPESFGFRPGRSVEQAVAAVARLRDEGFTHVIDADIRRFFECVPHGPLIARLQQSVADARIVRLVSQWLAASGPSGRGLAQGSPLSPLLANLYLDHLDEALRGKGVRLVRFADDFVVLCKSEARAQEVLARVTQELAALGLDLNAEKTRIVDFDKGFRFLGHLFVRALALKAEPLPEPFTIAAPANAARGAAQVSAPRPEPLEPEEPLAAPPEHDPFEALPLRAEALVPPALPVSDLAPVVRPLYLYEKGRILSTRSGAFTVEEGEAEIFACAVTRVDRIEIGPEAAADAEALRLAVDNSIPVVFVSGAGAPVAHLAPEIARHGRLHLEQARAALDGQRARTIASTIVLARIRNARALLRRLNRKRKDEAVAEAASKLGRILRKLDDAEDVEAARAVEAEAAALYWPAWGRTLVEGFPFRYRVRHPADSPVNLLLDFAAALLTRDVAAIAAQHGLHPGFGILHAARDEPGPLAYDLVEPYRAPLCEGFVVYALNNRIVMQQHFHRQDDGAHALFPEGRERFIRAYEAWLARPVRNPRRGTDTPWRVIIEGDIVAFRDALLSGAEFSFYDMGY
jgi:CRISPR-associated protein Cas1